MFTRRDVLRLAAVSTGSVLLASVFDLPAYADGTWPPTAAGSDDPYGTGTFLSHGLTYTISFIDVVNAEVSPTDPSSQAGPAIATVSGFMYDTSHAFSNQYTYSSGRYGRSVPNSTGAWWGTDMGSQSGLWRIISVEAFASVGTRINRQYQSSTTGTGYPVLRYKITVANPPSSSMDVTVRIANGVSEVEAFAGVDNSDDVGGPLPGSASAMGTYCGSQLNATASDSNDPATDQKYNYNKGDSFQNAHLTNGVGYFYLTAPVTASADESWDGSIQGGEIDVAWAQSSWEFVPIAVVGP